MIISGVGWINLTYVCPGIFSIPFLLAPWLSIGHILLQAWSIIGLIHTMIVTGKEGHMTCLKGGRSEPFPAIHTPMLGRRLLLFPWGSRSCLKTLEAISPTTWVRSTLGAWENDPGRDKHKRERKRGRQKKKRGKLILISILGPDSCLSSSHDVRYPSLLSGMKMVKSFFRT